MLCLGEWHGELFSLGLLARFVTNSDAPQGRGGSTWPCGCSLLLPTAAQTTYCACHGGPTAPRPHTLVATGPAALVGHAGAERACAEEGGPADAETGGDRRPAETQDRHRAFKILIAGGVFLGLDC